MIERLLEYWHVIVTTTMVLIFMLRMEGRLGVHGIRIDKLEAQREADRDEFLLVMRDMNNKLDRLIERNLK